MYICYVSMALCDEKNAPSCSAIFLVQFLYLALKHDPTKKQGPKPKKNRSPKDMTMLEWVCEGRGRSERCYRIYSKDHKLIRIFSPYFFNQINPNLLFHFLRPRSPDIMILTGTRRFIIKFFRGIWVARVVGFLVSRLEVAHNIL